MLYLGLFNKQMWHGLKRVDHYKWQPRNDRMLFSKARWLLSYLNASDINFSVSTETYSVSYILRDSHPSCVCHHYTQYRPCAEAALSRASCRKRPTQRRLTRMLRKSVVRIDPAQNRSKWRASVLVCLALRLSRRTLRTNWWHRHFGASISTQPAAPNPSVSTSAKFHRARFPAPLEARFLLRNVGNRWHAHWSAGDRATYFLTMHQVGHVLAAYWTTLYR
jgi:hypothetical protein